MDGQLLVGGTLDLGDVSPAAVESHRVVLTSESRRPLRIVGVQVTCGCIAAPDLRGTTLESGRGLDVGFAVDVRSLRAGPFKQRLTVLAEDMRGKPYSSSLWVQGTVTRALTPESRRIEFIAGEGGGVATGRVSFAGPVDGWTVTAVAWTDEGRGLRELRLTGEDTGRGTRTFNLAFDVPAWGPGVYEDHLVVETSHPDLPKVVFPVFIRVAAGVEVMPPRILLGRCRAGRPGAWFEVRIGARAVSVRGVTLRGEGHGQGTVELEVIATDENRSIVRARYSGAPIGVRSAVIRGVAELEADGSRLSIPITGRVLGAGR